MFCVLFSCPDSWCLVLFPGWCEIMRNILRQCLTAFAIGWFSSRPFRLLNLGCSVSYLARSAACPLDRLFMSPRNFFALLSSILQTLAFSVTPLALLSLPRPHYFMIAAANKLVGKGSGIEHTRTTLLKIHITLPSYCLQPTSLVRVMVCSLAE